MDNRMSTGIRGPEDIPLIPSVVKPFPARGRTVPLLSGILGGRQSNFSQGRR